MNVYVDSSVVLRVVLADGARLQAWSRIARPISSELCRVECFRTLDRLRLAGLLDDDEVADKRVAVEDVLEGFDKVAVDRRVLRRASEPMPTLLGTLDAIHVASALAARARDASLNRVATHDAAMATAARALGFRVLS